MTTTDTHSTATVTLRTTGTLIRDTCCLCDATIEKDPVKALLNDDWRTVVCHDCLAAGPDGISARLTAQADRVEAEAARRAAALREAAHARWVMPTLEEWGNATHGENQ